MPKEHICFWRNTGLTFHVCMRKWKLTVELERRPSPFWHLLRHEFWFILGDTFRFSWLIDAPYSNIWEIRLPFMRFVMEFVGRGSRFEEV